MNVVVFGINPQSAESHREFRDRNKFPFPLLVDADQKVAALVQLGWRHGESHGVPDRPGRHDPLRPTRHAATAGSACGCATQSVSEARQKSVAGIGRGTICRSATNQFDFDFIVIGSGFGGSVTAHRLVEKGYRVAVMEMGRRWTPENLPKTSWSMHRWFWRPGIALRGFFNMRFFRHVTILHGCAVGGGSITYACTMLRPPDKVWDSGSWKGLDDWKSEMPRHYDTASQMLGVTVNKILGPADRLLKTVADSAGVGDTFYRTSVAIFQAPEGVPGGVTYPDPYFGGEGPGANHVQRLRRLHDGLPPRREKHPRHELPVPRRKTRRARYFRKRAWWMCSRSTAQPTAAAGTGSPP